jgi:hypothetical protein
MTSTGMMIGASQTGAPSGRSREEVHAVAHQRHHRHRDEHHDGERERHGDVGGEGEGVGQHAEQVAEQHEHEDREDEGEVLLALVAHLVAHHAGDEFIGGFAERLQPARNERAASGAGEHQPGGQRHRYQHEEVRLAEGHGLADRAQDGRQLELAESVDRLAFDCHRLIPRRSLTSCASADVD